MHACGREDLLRLKAVLLFFVSFVSFVFLVFFFSFFYVFLFLFFFFSYFFSVFFSFFRSLAFGSVFVSFLELGFFRTLASAMRKLARRPAQYGLCVCRLNRRLSLRVPSWGKGNRPVEGFPHREKTHLLVGGSQSSRECCLCNSTLVRDKVAKRTGKVECRCKVDVQKRQGPKLVNRPNASACPQPVSSDQNH